MRSSAPPARRCFASTRFRPWRPAHCGKSANSTPASNTTRSNSRGRTELASQCRHHQKRDHPEQHADQSERYQRVVAVGQVVDETSAPRAERRAKAAADDNGAVDGSDMLAAK